MYKYEVTVKYKKHYDDRDVKSTKWSGTALNTRNAEIKAYNWIIENHPTWHTVEYITRRGEEIESLVGKVSD